MFDLELPFLPPSFASARFSLFLSLHSVKEARQQRARAQFCVGLDLYSCAPLFELKEETDQDCTENRKEKNPSPRLAVTMI